MPSNTEQEPRSASASSPSQETAPIELEQDEIHRQAASAELAAPATTTTPSMTPREQELWAMSFEELFQEARNHGFGKGKSESRKSGRVHILKWILHKQGITPYAAPRDTTTATTASSYTTNTTTTTIPTRNRNGAIDHPEAILRTSDPALQRQIDAGKAEYLKTWTAADMTALAMQRSYQLFKDSAGKMPTRAKPALAEWLAAWDVLKSPREKRWWLGDGIDLVNKAKALGYEGASTKKYDVIVWLRSTPEDVDAWVANVAEPTPVAKPPPPSSHKGTAGAVVAGGNRVSKRPAKGSQRPVGWNRKGLLNA